MRVIVVMGEPGTGKTTLVRSIMKMTGPWTPRFSDVKLVPYHESEGGHLVILGKYEDGETFAGTDRMSMAVQPEAVKFLQACSAGGVSAVLFEGDRLANISFLEHCLDNYDTTIVYLEVSKATREKRFAERGSNQSEQFLRSRDTKCANIMTNFQIMMALEKMVHETGEDCRLAANFIVNKLNGTDSIS